MEIFFEGKYKSLNSFECIDLPSFVILIGRNGSGKTQLLEAIKGDNPNNQHSYTMEVRPFKDSYPFNTSTSDFQYDMKIGAVKQDDVKAAYQYVESHLRKISPKIYEILDKIKLDLKVDPFEKIDSISLMEIFNAGDVATITDIYNDIVEFGNLGKPMSHSEKTPYALVEEQIVSNIKKFEPFIKIVDYCCERYGLERNQFKPTDIYNYDVPEAMLSKSRFENYSLSKSFGIYLRRRFYNNLNWLKSNSKGSYSDAEFVSRYPPPWELINEIFTNLKLKFRITEFDLDDYNPDQFHLDVYLIDLLSSTKLHYSELSSGEKVILGILDKVFGFKMVHSNMILPEIILLDEPDSALHPESVVILMKMLKEEFVEKLKIHVILTTHSPTTVALAEDKSIYKISNGSSTKIQKVSKDLALVELTGSIPTLSINYNNHRQVLVEGEIDNKYYSTIYLKCNEDNNLTYKPYFINLKAGDGSCEKVKELVLSFMDAGVQSCYGITDWDSSNSDDVNNNIYVHGCNKRYSIENYIYDPLYIAVLLLYKGGDSIHSALGKDKTYSELSLVNDPILAQQAVDWIFSKIYQSSSALASDKALIETKYYDGLTVNVPQWYFMKKGHDLHAIITKSFLSINNLSEFELSSELITVMAKCYPSIPKDSVSLLKAILS